MLDGRGYFEPCQAPADGFTRRSPSLVEGGSLGNRSLSSHQFSNRQKFELAAAQKKQPMPLVSNRNIARLETNLTFLESTRVRLLIATKHDFHDNTKENASCGDFSPARGVFQDRTGAIAPTDRRALGARRRCCSRLLRCGSGWRLASYRDLHAPQNKKRKNRGD